MVLTHSKNLYFSTNFKNILIFYCFFSMLFLGCASTQNITRDVSLTSQKKSNQTVTMAISYFDNLSNDKTYEFLGKGLSETLITDLSVHKDLKIVERSRLNDVLEEIKIQKNPYFDKDSRAQIGKGLGADLLIVGSFHISEDQLRINARIIFVEDGSVAFSTNLKGSTKKFNTLQRELSTKLLSGLDYNLTILEKSKISGGSTSDVEEFNKYSQALHYIDNNQNEKSSLLLKEIIAKNPTFDLASKLEERIQNLQKEVERLGKSGGIIKEPKNAVEAYYNSRIYLSLNQKNKYKASILKAFTLSPNSFDLLYELASNLTKSEFYNTIDNIGLKNCEADFVKEIIHLKTKKSEYVKATTSCDLTSSLAHAIFYGLSNFNDSELSNDSIITKLKAIQFIKFNSTTDSLQTKVFKHDKTLVEVIDKEMSFYLSKVRSDQLYQQGMINNDLTYLDLAIRHVVPVNGRKFDQKTVLILYGASFEKLKLQYLVDNDISSCTFKRTSREGAISHYTVSQEVGNDCIENFIKKPNHLGFIPIDHKFVEGGILYTVLPRIFHQKGFYWNLDFEKCYLPHILNSKDGKNYEVFNKLNNLDYNFFNTPTFDRHKVGRQTLNFRTLKSIDIDVFLSRPSWLGMNLMRNGTFGTGTRNIIKPINSKGIYATSCIVKKQEINNLDSKMNRIKRIVYRYNHLNVDRSYVFYTLLFKKNYKDAVDYVLQEDSDHIYLKYSLEQDNTWLNILRATNHLSKMIDYRHHEVESLVRKVSNIKAPSLHTSSMQTVTQLIDFVANKLIAGSDIDSINILEAFRNLSSKTKDDQKDYNMLSLLFWYNRESSDPQVVTLPQIKYDLPKSSTLFTMDSMDYGYASKFDISITEPSKIFSPSLTVRAKKIDQYEVTVDKYFECVESKNCTIPKYVDKICKVFKQFPICLGRKLVPNNYPATMLTAANASQYCKWKKGRLPNYKEWMVAAHSVKSEEVLSVNKENIATCDFYQTALDKKSCRGNKNFLNPNSGLAPVYNFFNTFFNRSDVHNISGNVSEMVSNSTGDLIAVGCNYIDFNQPGSKCIHNIFRSRTKQSGNRIEDKKQKLQNLEISLKARINQFMLKHKLDSYKLNLIHKKIRLQRKVAQQTKLSGHNNSPLSNFLGLDNHLNPIEKEYLDIVSKYDADINSINNSTSKITSEYEGRDFIGFRCVYD